MSKKKDDNIQVAGGLSPDNTLSEKKGRGRPRRKLLSSELVEVAQEVDLFPDISSLADEEKTSIRSTYIREDLDNSSIEDNLNKSSILCNDLNSNIDNISLNKESKKQFNEREIKFLNLWFSGNFVEKWRAVKGAGYNCSTKHAFTNQANIILKKYDTLTDHREIMRDIGAGESAILKKLLILAENSKDERVQIQALAILSKCAGLQREVIDADRGGDIIINLPSGQSKGGIVQAGVIVEDKRKLIVVK